METKKLVNDPSKDVSTGLGSVKIYIKRKESAKDLPIPSYATEGSSGVDLYADVEENVVLSPGKIKLISCGIYIGLPKGYEAQIRPRSGLALKHGITMVNTPGTIDSDYRGLIGLIVTNLGEKDYEITRGLRLAQMIVQKVSRADFHEVEDLDETVRADGGFGHTGV